MTPNEILDDIIHAIDPENVPVEFIFLAKIKDFNGNETVVRGEELEQFMNGPDSANIAEASVILDKKRIRRAITTEVDYIYDEVNRMLSEKDTDL